MSIDLATFNTGNLLTFIQIIVVGVGFYYSHNSLKTAQASLNTASDNLALSSNSAKLAASNAQAQLFNQLIIQGRDLQFRRWELFVDPIFDTTPEGENEALLIKQNEFIGVVIQYYASCFELRSVLSLPDSVNKLLDNDYKSIMRHKPFRDKYDELKSKNLLSRNFIEYTDRMYGV